MQKKKATLCNPFYLLSEHKRTQRYKHVRTHKKEEKKNRNFFIKTLAVNAEMDERIC